MVRSWLNELDGLPRGGRRRFRPSLEALDQRIVPALAVNDLTTGVTPLQLIQNLTGSGVNVTGVTFVGANEAAGLFTGGSGIIGFESGVILGSGEVNTVIGPNTSDGLGGPASNANGLAGDTDLDSISANTTFDATVLEFDFVPASETLSFDYVFTSEEYNEFVFSGVNDVFAFFLNGTNVALIPNTTTAINIDTVNTTTNTQFYVNNARPSDPEPGPATLLDTEMDGLTVVLTVTTTVNPGVVNHIKLAIADAGDSILDSNVFIREGSFFSPQIPEFTLYRPFRYAFRDLLQNQGSRGPTPVGGMAGEESFDGILTFLNTGTGDAFGTLRITLTQLPAGVEVLNATDTNPDTGLAFIDVPDVFMPAGVFVPLRVPVKLSNPNLAPLGTFFIGPYFADVSIVNS